jgi:hypothetical protein
MTRDPQGLLAEFDALGRDVAALLHDADGDPSTLLARRDAILDELRSLTSDLAPRPVTVGDGPADTLGDALGASLAATDALRADAAARRDDLRQALLSLGRARRAGEAYGAVGRFYDARGRR